MQKIRLILALIVAVTAISSASILIVLANAPGPVTAFWRLAFSVFLILILNRSIALPDDVYAIKYPLIAGVALGIHFASWMQSLFYASIAVSTTIVCMDSLFSGLFSTMFGEKPRIGQILGVAIALMGVYMLSGADPTSSPLGVMLALIGAAAGGLYFTIGRIVRNKLDFGTYVTLTYAFATIVTLIISLIYGYKLISYPAKTWICFILLAIIPMILGHTLLNYVLRHMEVLPVTASVIGESVGATILAYLILGQALQPIAYLYMLLILIGIAVTLKS